MPTRPEYANGRGHASDGDGCRVGQRGRSLVDDSGGYCRRRGSESRAEEFEHLAGFRCNGTAIDHGPVRPHGGDVPVRGEERGGNFEEGRADRGGSPAELVTATETAPVPGSDGASTLIWVGLT